MLNVVNLAGRLTGDPELRYTPKNTPVTTFVLAVERDLQAAGEERKVDYVNCVAWDKTAEFISKYFTKGRMMILAGRLQSKKWQDREGNNRTQWEVVVSSAYFAGDKKAAAQSGEESEKRPASPFRDFDGDEEDLPF